MNKLKYCFLLLIIASCNKGDDCEQYKKALSGCQADNLTLQEVNNTLSTQIKYCIELNDSLKNLPPVIVHKVDTLVLRDTIIKSDTIYQRDTVCVPTVQCDTIMLKRMLLFNGDTNWQFKNYVCCPLEIYQEYTDIVLTAISTGMHHGEHDYEFGCVTVEVNGSDSLIMFGRHMCLDLNLEQGQFSTRVNLPMKDIKTITYTFYNDNYGYYNGEYEDINVFFYGVTIDTLDVFSRQYISTEGYPGWMDYDSYLELRRNGSFTVNLN